MRAAATAAGTIIVLGIYLAIAAAMAFTASWIGIGMLAVSAAGSIGVMLASAPGGGARGAARS